MKFTVEGEKLNVPATRTDCEAGVYPGAEAVIVAVPNPVPTICGCVEGVTAPAGTNTVGVIVTSPALLVNVTVTPPAGAATDSVTGNGAGWFGASCTFEGRITAPPGFVLVTVTVAVPFVTFAALAVIVAEPAATPVTGTETLVAPAPIVTAEGAVATAGFDELSVTVTAVGDAADMLNVVLCTAVPVIEILWGEKLSAPFT